MESASKKFTLPKSLPNQLGNVSTPTVSRFERIIETHSFFQGFAWWTLRIFFIFSPWERGRGSPRHWEGMGGGRVGFLLKIPGGGGSPRRGRGGDVGLHCENRHMFFKIQRCEMPAMRTLAAAWPAMRAPAMRAPAMSSC